MRWVSFFIKSLTSVYHALYRRIFFIYSVCFIGSFGADKKEGTHQKNPAGRRANHKNKGGFPKNRRRNSLFSYWRYNYIALSANRTCEYVVYLQKIRVGYHD
jgi:hypothetical protein